VTASNATSWPAYLPKLDAQHEWVYWWNQTVVEAPGWINIDVTAIADFPLFLARPVQPVVV